MNMMNWVDQTLGQYRIEAPLGAGGMGQVFRGMHMYLNRPVATKVMEANVAADPTFRARFLQEAKAAAALKHPNIVEIYDFNEQDGTFYLVSDFNTAYVTEQLSNSTGQLVRVNVASGNSMVLATSTMAPLFEMAWANANHTALLVTERDPANKVWYFDLTQPSAGLQFVASVGSRPSSVAKVSSDNLYPLLICANSEIDKLT